MPGLVGLLSDRSESTLFDSMQQSMNHRKYSIKNFTQNGLHLSLLHTTNASTGVHHSADGHFTVFFHGEIFSVDGEDNKDIATSATVFLRHLETKGLDVLAKINGQFSACLYDHPAQTLFLINDRFDTRPVYYTLANNRLLFASEVKALLKDSFTRTIDLRGIADLFSFGYVTESKTLFEGIHRLPPATVLKFKFGSGASLSPAYWTYPYSERVYASGRIDRKKSDALAERLGSVFLAATKRQHADSDKLLIPLSGGLDSRYAVALYHHIGARSISTFTMGPDESEDQLYASMVARELDFPHYKSHIKPADTWQAGSFFSYASDGMSNISGPLQNFEAFDHFSSSKEILSASQMCDVLFGSTLFRKRIKTLQKNEVSRQASDEILINFFRVIDQQQVQFLFREEVYEKIKGLYREVSQKYCRREFHPLHNYFLLQMGEKGRRGTLGGNITANLYYQMRMLSYDNEVSDFSWDLPIAYREHQHLYRKTFTQLFPTLATIRRQGLNLKISASQTLYELKILENKIATIAMKSPLRSLARLYKPWARPNYVSYREWFRNELRSPLMNLLLANELKCQDIVKPQSVKAIVEEHLNEKRDNTAIIWQIINLEYFYRHFIV